MGEGETEPRISSEYGIQGNKHSGGGCGVNANILEHKKDGCVRPHPHWQKGPLL